MGNNLPMEFGNYVLLDLVARGGMAEIYKAKMRTGIDGFEKLVAIKKILPNLAENEEFITMLIDEARISVSLNHSNIAQVYDLGRVGDSYYIAMEFVPGIDLSHMIKKLGKDGFLLPLDHATFITKELCSGLYFAHRKTDDNGNLLGIVHRDISPHNILVSYNGDVKIIDFGVAKASVKLSQTRMGVIKGKLLYMAPEQAMARPIDARADIFSAGLCLYRMLTGHLPFEADNEFQIYNNVLTAPIKPPKELNPEIPDDLNAVVMKSLARELNERYADGWLMHQDLEDVLQRVSPGYTSQRLSRFMEEYFADDRPSALIPTARSNPSRAEPKASSYPSTPSAQSAPSGLAAAAPDTPSNFQHPVTVGEPAGHVVGEPGAFVASGPTVPISGAEIANMLAADPVRSMPPLPSPEELGYKPTQPILEDEEYDADPTIDMKLDPSIMQQMGELMAAQPASAVKTGARVPGRNKPKVGRGKVTGKPKAKPTSRPTPTTSPSPRKSSGVKISLLLLILAVILLLSAVVVGFFLFGGLELLGIGGGEAAKSNPPAAVGKTNPNAKAGSTTKGESPDKKAAPAEDAEPGKAFTAAYESFGKSLSKARIESNALVSIKLTTNPAGATVYRKKTKIGTSPTSLHVPRDEAPIVFTFKMKGYSNSTAEIVPSTDRSSTIKMEPKGKRSEKSNPKKDDKKKDDKKKDNDLLDPW